MLYEDTSPGDYLDTKSDVMFGLSDELHYFANWIKSQTGIDEVSNDIPQTIHEIAANLAEQAAELRHVPDWIYEDLRDNLSNEDILSATNSEGNKNDI